MFGPPPPPPKPDAPKPLTPTPTPAPEPKQPCPPASRHPGPPARLPPVLGKCKKVGWGPKQGQRAPTASVSSRGRADEGRRGLQMRRSWETMAYIERGICGFVCYPVLIQSGRRWILFLEILVGMFCS